MFRGYQEHKHHISESNFTFNYKTYKHFFKGDVSDETKAVQIVDYLSNPSIYKKNSKVIDFMLNWIIP